MKYIYTLFLFYSFSTLAYCQDKNIFIKDAVNNFIIPNAYILNDLNKGFLTDSNGAFSWSIIANNTNKIKISALGYNDITINTDKIPLNYTIYLQPRYSNLKDVIIYSNANNILKKSINNIEKNYFNSPYKLRGLYKTYNIDSLNNYYFNSEALLEYYINPSSKESLSRTFIVKLISKINRSSTSHWYGYGKYYDPVLSKKGIINISNINKYNFVNLGIFEYNGRKTYNIEYTLKKDNYINGVIYIDSLTKAFVKIKEEFYNPPKEVFMKKIVYAKKEVGYTNFKDKWYVKYINSTTQHENYAYPTIISDYLTIDVNNSNFNFPNSNTFVPINIDNDKISSNYDSTFTDYETNILDDTSYFRAISLNKNLITIDKKYDSILNKKEFKLQEEKILRKSIPISRSGYGINITQPYNVDPTLGLYIESKNLYNIRLGFGYNNNLNFNNNNQSSILFDLYYSNKSNEDKVFVIHPIIQFQKFYGKKKIENAIYSINSHAVSAGFKLDYQVKSDRLLSCKITYSLPSTYANSIIVKNSFNFSLIYSGILY